MKHVLDVDVGAGSQNVPFTCKRPWAFSRFIYHEEINSIHCNKVLPTETVALILPSSSSPQF